MGSILGSITALTITVQVKAAVEAKQLLGYDGKPAIADAPVLGVAKTDADIGTDIAVDVIGLFELIAAAAIAQDDLVASNADGAPIPTTDSTKAFGRALTAAANPGDIVNILIK